MRKKLVYALFDAGARGVMTAEALLKQSRENENKGREVEVVMVSGRINTQMSKLCRFTFSVDKSTNPRDLVKLLKMRGVTIAIINSEDYSYFTRYLEEAGIEVVGPV